jgi:hypothetical protein
MVTAGNVPHGPAQHVDSERESLILGYHSASILGVGGIRTGHMTDGMVQRLDKAGRLGETKRCLLSMTNAQWCGVGR